jgi:toxin ParE1/3/4
MDYQIILAPKALQDLESIIAYIAQDNPGAANKFGTKLIEYTRVLHVSPTIGKEVPEFENPDIRQLILKPYRVIYKIDEANKQIHVSRYWHSSRDNLDL